MFVFNVELEWMRPRQQMAGRGFELVAAHEGRLPDIKPPSLFAAISNRTVPVPDQISWVGGVSLEKYRPLEQFPKLPLEIARIVSPLTALKFYNQFGSLYVRDPSAQGCKDEIPEILAFADSVRAFYSNYRGSGFKRLVQTLRESGDPDLPLTYSLAPHPRRDELQVRLRADNLESAIAVQLMLAVSGEKIRRPCEHCGKQFSAGKGSNPPRRRQAKYCSPKCQIAANSLNRAKGN